MCGVHQIEKPTEVERMTHELVGTGLTDFSAV